jgi:hypothetical protein
MKVGCCNGKILDLYLGYDWSESLSGHQIFWLKVFIVFLSSPTYEGSSPIRQKHFLPKTFQFIIQQSSYHSTPVSINPDSIVK